MQSMTWILAGLFLPLFPLGMVFNAVFQRVRSPWMRSVLFLLWPVPGVAILHNMHKVQIPDWILIWALLSAILYSFRAVVIREFSVWTGYIATAAWTLAWIPMAVGAKSNIPIMHVLAFSLPLILLTFLVGELERRYESAYAGIVSGVAEAQPRLSGMLVLVTLAVIGSPVFPGFVAMLSNITHTITVQPVIAVGLTLVWLLWSWSGVRLLQELLVGSASRDNSSQDISKGSTTVYVVLLLALIIGSLYLAGVLL